MAEPLNIQEMSAEEFKQFLNEFDHVFSDCDGVIWSKTPYPRVSEFFTLMQRLGKTVNFVSNNSINTEENYRSMFKAAGIENGFERLTFPSLAIVEYLKSKNFDKHLYCITCKTAIKTFNAHGIKTKIGPDEGIDYHLTSTSYIEDPEIGAVAFDSDFKVNLTKLHKAIAALRKPDVLFLSGASDRRIPLHDGKLALGPGTFTNIVAESVNREPVSLGKPGRMFGEFAMKRAGVTDASRVLFIGDMIDQDVGLGRNTGFKTLLVLTHIPKEEMMAHEIIKPDYYADDLAAIVPFLEKAI